MKALSVKQPWAEWIASGEKTIETQRWATRHRGPLLICASKAFDYDSCYIIGEDEEYPRGCAVAIAKLADCRPMTRQDQAEAMCLMEQGAYAWILERVRRIEPFPVKGKLGLFEVEYGEST